MSASRGTEAEEQAPITPRLMGSVKDLMAHS